MDQMEFVLETQTGSRPFALEYDKLVAVGYSGRDTQKILAHIRELEEKLGVPAPRQIPTIFHCGRQLLTQKGQIGVVGQKTCGEAEYVIVCQGGEWYIGLGSDHTDRQLEAVSVAKSKQVCPKPIAPVLWPYRELADHWDSILLESSQQAGGEWVPYQKGSLADILPPQEILRQLTSRAGDMSRAVIFSGTVPLLGNFVFGSRFACRMTDPVLGRSMELSYSVEALQEEA